jgi:hypothetical protein
VLKSAHKSDAFTEGRETDAEDKGYGVSVNQKESGKHSFSAHDQIVVLAEN